MSMSEKKIAILAEDGYQELELHYPRLRFIEAGASVSVLGTGRNEYASEKGYMVDVDADVADVHANDFDAVVIPGGMAPDKMRRNRAMVQFVSDMHAQEKPVAWICHAGWMAISADIIRDRRVTSFASIRDDMINAGGNWVDEEVVVDGNLISSRMPPDLPAFCKALTEALSSA